jgi:hypothetical protein
MAAKFTRNQLIEMCTAAGLQKSGTKEALAERLISSRKINN